MIHNIDDIIRLNEFVDLTDRAQDFGSSHRPHFSRLLCECCREEPNDEQCGCDLATGIVEAAVANVHPTTTFPTFLWSHPWCPCVHSLPNDDGRLRLYLSLVNETRSGVAGMVDHCIAHCRFHEFAPDDRKPECSVRVYFSTRFGDHCRQREGTSRNSYVQRSFFFVAQLLYGPNTSPFLWLNPLGFSACSFRLLDEHGELCVYFMLAAECPAKGVTPFILS